MLTNRIELVKSSGVIHIGLSDHSMNFIVWGSPSTQSVPRVLNYRNFKDVDIVAFSERLQNQPRENVILESKLNQKYQQGRRKCQKGTKEDERQVRTQTKLRP